MNSFDRITIMVMLSIAAIAIVTSYKLNQIEYKTQLEVMSQSITNQGELNEK